jgi:hypothetical protein
LNTLCGRNVELLNVKPGGTYSDHWGLEGWYTCRRHVHECGTSEIGDISAAVELWRGNAN